MILFWLTIELKKKIGLFITLIKNDQLFTVFSRGHRHAQVRDS